MGLVLSSSPSATETLSVVLVNWNAKDDLRRCLQSLEHQTRPPEQIIVIDNASSDGSQRMVHEDFPDVVLDTFSENRGFAAACNRGIELATGSWVAMLNNDAVAHAEWCAALVEAAAKAPSNCGMLQSMMLYLERPDVVNSTGINLLRHGDGVDRAEGQHRERCDPPTDVFCATAGAAAYRRVMLEQTKISSGYFDADYFLYKEDFDLGWRARIAGWTAQYVPEAVVSHRWHGSTRHVDQTWLRRMQRTNYIETLLKNASWRFVAMALPLRFFPLLRVYAEHPIAATRDFLRAIRSGLAKRPEITAMQKTTRASVERMWLR